MDIKNIKIFNLGDLYKCHLAIKKMGKLYDKIYNIEHDLNHDKSIDYSRFDENFQNIIKKFTSKLGDKLNDSFFYGNINNLSLEYVENIHSFNDESEVMAEYLPKENKIIYKDLFYVYHELFHLVTANVYKDKKFVGFHQNKFGIALNEGYTQLLVKRYFKDNYAENAYRYETYFCELLELIVGQDKMEKLYLQSDLMGLIKELRKYNELRKIIKFINELDMLMYLNSYFTENNIKKSKSARIMCKYIFKDMSIFLMETAMKKSKIIIKSQDNLETETFKKVISELIDGLVGKDMIFKGNIYPLISRMDMSKCLVKSKLKK